MDPRDRKSQFVSLWALPHKTQKKQLDSLYGMILKLLESVFAVSSSWKTAGNTW
jgi:hypothetical protein